MAWLVLFILLQAGDGFLTWLTVDYLKTADEWNPLVRKGFENFGLIETLILVKTFSVLMGIFLYQKVTNKSALIFLTGLTFGIVAMQILGLFRIAPDN